MKYENDKDALYRIKQGDIDRYEIIVKKYTGRIHQYISSKLFNKEEVDDIVQTTFIRFYKAINRFDETKQILPYLYEIAKNELKMFFRSHKETLQLNEQTAGGPAQEYFTDIELEQLLQSIPPDQQKAIKMLYEGYTYREIATILKRPINTVRTIISRTRKLLIVHHKL